MNPETPRDSAGNSAGCSARYSAVVGCGPSGCMVVRLLARSSAKARLVAIDADQRALDESEADLEIKAEPGSAPKADIGALEVVFIVLDPTEPGAAGWAAEVASRASADGAYTFGVAVLPPGEATPDLTSVRRMFKGVSLVDARWVFEKRGSKDPVMALQIALNFTAHTLTFLTGVIDGGDLSVTALRSATEGRITAFAASHMSDPISIYSLTMSKINRATIRSGIVFLDDAIEDIPARRIFWAIGRSLPKAELSLIRTKGLTPFKILAMLAQ